MNENDNVLGVIQQGAIATHELFQSYVRAGFTREESLKLVMNVQAAKIMREDK
jgi:hypothetical protein